MEEDLRQVRIDKLARLREAGIAPYPERFERTHTLAEAAVAPEGTAGMRLAGRMISVRTFGKLTFAHLQDQTGRLQFALRRADLDDATWSIFHDLCDRGDHLGVEGDLFVTKKGEKTLAVRTLTFLGKALRPLPEKWHGLKDPELKQRQRYLDLIMSEETRRRFRLRAQVLRVLRRFLDDRGFQEVETPVLQTVPSGATARPFITHHNAFDTDVYLSISPETWLKRLVVGGYDRVYEVARCFRNEGLDPSHLQDFTMLEFYVAYWSWEDNLRFTEELVRHLLQEVLGTLKLLWRGREIDFSGRWPRLEMGALIEERTGIDLDACPTVEALRDAAKKKKLPLERIDVLGRGGLIDAIYRQAVRPELIQPCFLTGIPADTLPLARRNDERPHLADCFQLVVNGWEIVKAYSELVDPVDQRARFLDQERLRTGGDEEAMFLDEDYLVAMEHGLPPVSGWGMGIDRLCALLAGADSLRDVVLFPLLRPRTEEEGAGNVERAEKAGAAGPPETAKTAGSAANAGNTGSAANAGNTGNVGDAGRPANAANVGGPGNAGDAGAAGADSSADVGEFGMSRDRAMELFKEHVSSDHLTRHSLASAAVMEAIGKRFGKNRDTYWCMGFLHDLDFDKVKEPDRHTLETVRILKENGVTDETILHAILSHNAEGLGVARASWLDYALSCGETVTGLVMAATLVLPDRKLASLKPSSVKKRMKKKDFARQVSRENILQCEKIGLAIEEFCELAVSAMQEIAPELGL